MYSHPNLVSSSVAAKGIRVRIVRLMGLAALGLVVAGWGCAETFQTRAGGAPHATIPAPKKDLNSLRQQQDALRDQIEEMTRSLEVLEQSFDTAEQRIAANLSSIEKIYAKVTKLSEGLKMVGGPVEEPLISTEEPSEEATSLRSRYAEAYSVFKVGEYVTAIEKFRGFTEHYPQSRLADNAQYWIAESYLALKDYHRALEEYRRVERNYPNGNRVPDALLRGGQTLYALEDTRGFVRELKRLIRLFPEDRAAQIAAESIAKLASE